MDSSPIIVLAIAPGRREFGVAVFIGTELIYCSVKTFKKRQSNKLLLTEITEILQSLLAGFSPKVVVVKAISQYQKLAPDLEKISKHIELESKRNGLQFIKITLEQIKSAFDTGGKSTQKAAFRKLLHSYPELKRYWNRPNKWQNDYYAVLFSAVAVGAVYLKSHSVID